MDSGRLPWWVAASQRVRAAAHSRRFVRRTSKSIGRRIFWGRLLFIDCITQAERSGKCLAIFPCCLSMYASVPLAPPCPGVGGVKGQWHGELRFCASALNAISGGGMGTAVLGTGCAGPAARRARIVHSSL